MREETPTKLAAFPIEWQQTSGDLIRLKQPIDPSPSVALIAELRMLHKSASQTSSPQAEQLHIER